MLDRKDLFFTKFNLEIIVYVSNFIVNIRIIVQYIKTLSIVISFLFNYSKLESGANLPLEKLK